MKRFLALLLALTLLLPVLSLAEEEGDSLEIEDVVTDENGNLIITDEDTGESYMIYSASEEQVEELSALYEPDDSVDPDTLEINPNLPDHVINILLIGLDVRGEGKNSGKLLSEQKDEVKHADVLMIMSFNTLDGSIRLSSISRNAYVTIPGRKNKDIIAYSYGHVPYVDGVAQKWVNTPELCVRTVNHNFEMNIQHYIAINFYGVASIIEDLGGVDIDLTKAEAKAINAYLKKNEKKISRTYDDKKGKREPLKAKDGVQHLDGIQGLMYARLRSLKGSDDRVRTGRTRRLLDSLLQATLARLKNNELDLFNLIGSFIQYPVTDMNGSELLQLVFQVYGSGILNQLGSADTLVKEFRIPMDGTYKDVTVKERSVTEFDLYRNTEALHTAIYGKYYPTH